MLKLEAINGALSLLITQQLKKKVVSEEVTEEYHADCYRVLLGEITLQSNVPAIATYAREVEIGIIYYPPTREKFKMPCLAAIQKIEALLMRFGIMSESVLLEFNRIESRIEDGCGVIVTSISELGSELPYDDFGEPTEEYLMEILVDKYTIN